MRIKLTEDSNLGRNKTYGIGKNNDDTDAVSDWIRKYISKLAFAVDNSTREYFKLTLNKKGNALSPGILNYTSETILKQIYNVVNTIIHPETGEPRTREFPPIDPKTGKTHKYYSEDKGGNYTGEKKPANWHFIKEHVYNFNPYHTKGGVAGSNIKHHFRPKLSKLLTGYEGFLGADMSDDEYVTFKKGRKAADKKVQKIFSSLR